MELMIFALGIGAFLFFTSILLPWINRTKIHEVREELLSVKRQLRDLRIYLEGENIHLPSHIAVPPKTSFVEPVSVSALAFSPQGMPSTLPTDIPKITSSESSMAEPIAQHTSRFEQQFGARLPVWIGGIALVLAGFFLVKYSIEIGLLTPFVRVVLGIAFGIGLLHAGERVRKNPRFSNGARISQSLSGAGIADLYICFFSATHLFGLPSFLGLLAMAWVTFTAVRLSLHHGAPIAILGLVGGLLTPALVSSSDPSAPLLFLYLYCLFAGLFVVLRQQQWWGIAVAAVAGNFLWVAMWIGHGPLDVVDSITLGLFLLAIGATVAVASRDVLEEKGPPALAVLHYLSFGGAAIFMGLTAGRAGFGEVEWGLFSLLSCAAIALSVVDQKRYGLVPWMAMGVNVIMLAVWRPDDIFMFAFVAWTFGSLFAASGYVLQRRSEQPLLWTGLTGAASLSYYLIGYYKLHDNALVTEFPHLWSGLALGLAALGAAILRHIMQEMPKDHPQKQHVMAIYTACGIAFLSLALMIELPREFLSVAFAVQVLALGWINTRAKIDALRPLAGAVALGFGVLLIPQVLLLVQLTAYSLVEAKLALQQGVPIVDWPCFQLGLPAVCFIGASLLFRRAKDGMLVRAFEASAIALITVMGYYVTRHVFHAAADVLFIKAGFFERGIITNTLFAYGVLCLWIGRNCARRAVSLSGLVLCGMAMFRIGYFDLIRYNPLWAEQSVGDVPLINALLLAYGFPILWLRQMNMELPYLHKDKWARCGQLFMLVLGFTLVSLEVCQFFHGSLLNDGIASNAEIYSYSVAWVLLGIGLLFFGAWKKDRLMRIASLTVMILAVGKVFLYDASELSGLFRVFSFFGLGLSLLGLSWFYTRFVFGDRDLLGKSNEQKD